MFEDVNVLLACSLGGCKNNKMVLKNQCCVLKTTYTEINFLKVKLCYPLFYFFKDCLSFYINTAWEAILAAIRIYYAQIMIVSTIY